MRWGEELVISEQVPTISAFTSGSDLFASGPHAEWFAKERTKNLTKLQSLLDDHASRNSNWTAGDHAGAAGVILVVDDEPAIAITLSHILERRNLPAVWLTDSQAAASLIERLPLRMMITDYDMPVVDGLTLATSVCLRDANCPVLLFTARASESDLVTSVDALKLCIYVQAKPVSLDRLIQVVRVLCDPEVPET